MSFSFDSPKDSPGLLLWQTTITWQRLIREALEPYDIAHSQYVVLAILLWFDEHQKPTNQTAVSRMSKLDKMTVSLCLKKLTQLKLVRRQEDIRDTRAKSVSLTPQGKALAQKLVALVESVDAQFFDKLSPDGMRGLVKLLGQLVV